MRHDSDNWVCPTIFSTTVANWWIELHVVQLLTSLQATLTQGYLKYGHSCNKLHVYATRLLSSISLSPVWGQISPFHWKYLSFLQLILLSFWWTLASQLHTSHCQLVDLYNSLGVLTSAKRVICIIAWEFLPLKRVIHQVQAEWTTWKYLYNWCTLHNSVNLSKLTLIPPFLFL